MRETSDSKLRTCGLPAIVIGNLAKIFKELDSGSLSDQLCKMTIANKSVVKEEKRDQGETNLYTHSFESLLSPLKTAKVYEEDPTGLRKTDTIGIGGILDLKSTEICQVKRHSMDGAPIVRILTYNIWFNYVTEQRLEEIVKVIKKADADFVCL